MEADENGPLIGDGSDVAVRVAAPSNESLYRATVRCVARDTDLLGGVGSHNIQHVTRHETDGSDARRPWTLVLVVAL